MKRVLFLCSGNYYRSRLAEIVFNWRARERGLAWVADSRGLRLDRCNIGPISRHTLSWLNGRGISCESVGRPPAAVVEADFAAAHRVIAVKEAEHRPLIESLFPQWQDRVEYWQVHDLDFAVPDEAIPLLEREVLNLLDRIDVAAA
jgi:protein-tyrosine phosphatase